MKLLKNNITQEDIQIVLDIYKKAKTDEYISAYHGPDIDKLIHYSDIVYCDISDPKLNLIAHKITGGSRQIYSIHIVTYKTGDKCDRHLDRSSNGTYITLLDNSFTGGALKVNDKVCELNTGDTAVFNGQREYHEVSLVESGVRQVLVVWTGNRPSSNKSTLI